MKNILTFKNYHLFYEAFDIIDGELVLDAPKSTTTGIPSSFGKGRFLKPYTKKLSDDLMTYSLYQAKNANSSEILKALKSADYSDEKVRHFLNRSAVYAVRILRDLDIDVIVTPRSSSDLTKEFVGEIQRRTNYDVIVDAFAKKIDLTKVEIDRNHPKITPQIIRSMESTLRLAIRRGHLYIKMFAPPHRKFVKNLFDIIDEQIYTRVKDKNVLIIDDIMTTGTSVSNIYDILKTNNAAEISALTLFKSSK